MGRCHASAIAKQLLEQGRAASTPVHILEAISTKRERKWSMSLFDLASLNIDHEPDESTWQQSDEPLLILIGEALAERASAKLNNGLQDSFTLTNSRRRA